MRAYIPLTCIRESTNRITNILQWNCVTIISRRRAENQDVSRTIKIMIKLTMCYFKQNREYEMYSICL